MICVTAFKHRPSRNICFWPSVAPPPPPKKKSIKFMTTIQARLPNCLIGVVLNYCSSLFLCSVVNWRPDSLEHLKGKRKRFFPLLLYLVWNLTCLVITRDIHRVVCPVIPFHKLKQNGNDSAGADWLDAVGWPPLVKVIQYLYCNVYRRTAEYWTSVFCLFARLWNWLKTVHWQRFILQMRRMVFCERLICWLLILCVRWDVWKGWGAGVLLGMTAPVLHMHGCLWNPRLNVSILYNYIAVVYPISLPCIQRSATWMWVHQSCYLLAVSVKVANNQALGNQGQRGNIWSEWFRNDTKTVDDAYYRLIVWGRIIFFPLDILIINKDVVWEILWWWKCVLGGEGRRGESSMPQASFFLSGMCTLFCYIVTVCVELNLVQVVMNMEACVKWNLLRWEKKEKNKTKTKQIVYEMRCVDPCVIKNTQAGCSLHKIWQPVFHRV